MAKLYDWVKQTVSGTPGTGAITLSTAVATFITMANAGLTDGDLVYYTIVDGNNRERGIGTYSTTGPTLTRTFIQGKLESGTYTENPGTGLTLTSAAIVGCSPVAATHNFRGCLLKRSANQTITSGVATAVAFTDETYDIGGFHDTVTNNSRITVPSNNGIAKVKLRANVRFAISSAGYRTAYIQKNGSAVIDGTAIIRADPTASNDFIINLSSPVLMVTGADYFELMVDQNSGGNLDLVGTSGHLWFALEVIE